MYRSSIYIISAKAGGFGTPRPIHFPARTPALSLRLQQSCRSSIDCAWLPPPLNCRRRLGMNECHRSESRVFSTTDILADGYFGEQVAQSGSLRLSTSEACLWGKALMRFFNPRASAQIRGRLSYAAALLLTALSC